MNRHDSSARDLEAATDQLVDEICQRLTALYALLDLSLDDAGPPVALIRRHAATLVAHCGGPDPRAAATAVARTLWPPRPGAAVTPAWWTTPLGALIADALAPTTGLVAAGRRPTRAADRTT